MSPEVEQSILEHSLDHPSHGCLRVAQELGLKGVQVSSNGVRGVWGRHKLMTKVQRLLRLEEHARKRKIKLSEEQIRLLERFDPEFRDRHIVVKYPGELLGVDTFFVGSLKGVGRVYMQSVIDCFSRHAWARLYTSKLPVTAVQILNNIVLPFFDTYNEKRPHQGRNMNGRVPLKAFKEGLKLVPKAVEEQSLKQAA